MVESTTCPGARSVRREGRVPLAETRVPSHALVLELQGTAGTNRFHQRLFPARLAGLTFIQAMEQS
jgi:hypothetical protein